MFKTMLSAGIAASLLFAPATASASIVEINGRGQLTFEGTVQYRIDDTIQVSNPDGSVTVFNRADVPDFGIAAGSTATTTISFSLTDPVFSLAGCSGRYSLGASVNQDTCAITARVETPFGTTQFGGAGGDVPPGIQGLVLNRDQSTGEFTLVDPVGDYSLSFLTVPNYQYDSFTGLLSAPGDPCVSAFNCPDDRATGNLNVQSFPLAITGDFGRVQPGFDVGYDAGLLGFFDIVGGFRSGNQPTPVPAPGMLLIFGLAAGGIGFLRRRKQAE
jgi:hypothetical protein